MVSLVIACICLLLVLSVSIAFNIKHARVILNLEDAIGDALEICDDAYASMSQVLELPVAYVTPEIHHVMRCVKNVRESVLLVSNVLADPYKGVASDDQEDEHVQE